MISKSVFKKLVEDNLIASVRVVPIPLESAWCIDVIIRRPMEVGSDTETVASRKTEQKPGVSRYESIDSAAEYLRSVGVEMFTVDLHDAVSLTNTSSQVVRIIETAARIWEDDADAASA